MMKSHRDCGKRAGCEAVVAVEPGQDLATRPCYALVDGVALSPVGLALPMGQKISVAGKNALRLVRRATVDDNVLEVWITLVGDRKDRVLDESAVVEGWRYDRDPGPGRAVRHVERQRMNVVFPERPPRVRSCYQTRPRRRF